MKKTLQTTHYKLQTHRGFTILETIIAITVIGLVIAAATQLTQSSLKIGRSTMNQFIALHLAEEGLETVRNIRDSNWLQNVSWRSGLDDGTYAVVKNSGNTGARWSLQKITGIDKVAPTQGRGINGLASLRLGLDGEEIILDEHQKFQRTVSIDAGKITSRVTYEQIGGEKEISLGMQLTDWKKGPL